MSFKVENNKLIFGSSAVSFQRTLRIPEDGKTYPLPPSFGFFPVHKIDDYIDKVPEDWKKHGGVFLPMYQREAMWIQFDGKENEPKACKVAIGKVNAISGKPWNQKFLKGEQQDYVVIPTQPWLDGINAGDGYIKQFVAMPLGGGYTVEAQVTGKEDIGGLQVIVYNAKPQRQQQQPIHKPVPVPQPYPQPVYKPIPQPIYQAPPPPPTMMAHHAPQVMPSSIPMPEMAQASFVDCYDEAEAAPVMMKMSEKKKAAPAMQRSVSKKPASSSFNDSFSAFAPPPPPVASAYAPAYAPIAPTSTVVPIAPPVRQVAPEPEAKEMGISAGGKMKQSIYEDKYGIDYWDENSFARVFIHIVNSTMYEQITGKKPPATPIDASAYTNFGYPWYDVYDENVPAVEASSILSQVKSVSEIDKHKYGYDKNNNQTVSIQANQVHTVVHKDNVRDGDW